MSDKNTTGGEYVFSRQDIVTVAEKIYDWDNDATTDMNLNLYQKIDKEIQDLPSRFIPRSQPTPEIAELPTEGLEKIADNITSSSEGISKYMGKSARIANFLLGYDHASSLALTIIKGKDETIDRMATRMQEMAKELIGKDEEIKGLKEENEKKNIEIENMILSGFL